MGVMYTPGELEAVHVWVMETACRSKVSVRVSVVRVLCVRLSAYSASVVRVLCVCLLSVYLLYTWVRVGHGDCLSLEGNSCVCFCCPCTSCMLGCVWVTVTACLSKVRVYECGCV